MKTTTRLRGAAWVVMIELDAVRAATTKAQICFRRGHPRRAPSGGTAVHSDPSDLVVCVRKHLRNFTAAILLERDS